MFLFIQDVKQTSLRILHQERIIPIKIKINQFSFIIHQTKL